MLINTRDAVVGRRRELELIIACLEAGKHILLEGAPGTSKSTILTEISENSNLPLYIMEGNADLTPAKIVGNFDPALVLEHGMQPEYFIKGPLYKAMEEGGIFYVDEFNRMAPDASNTLIRAIEENVLVVPRIGQIKAHKHFRVVLAQNPFDDVGVGRISRALFDRLIRIQMHYQTEVEEQEIVRRETNPEIQSQFIRIAVQLVRATRMHPEIKQGASVRGAMDLVTIVSSLVELGSERSSFEVLRDAAWAALSGKIWIDPSSDRSAEDIIEELLLQILTANQLAFPDDLEDWEILKKKMTDEDSSILVDEEVAITTDEAEGNLQGKGIDNFAQEHGTDRIEMVGSVLLELQADVRKRVVHWATRLLIQETSELLGIRRNIPRYVSERPKREFLDFDLDGTIEKVMEDPIRKFEALRVFNRARADHSALLIIDSSYSMSGKKVVLAAALAATVSHIFDTQNIAVIHFGTKGHVLKRFDIEMSPETLVEQIFSLTPKGLTNIYLGLKVAIEELGERKHGKYTAFLMSDCDVNAGKVPSVIAWRLPGLKIITMPPEVNDFVAGIIAKETRGEIFPAANARDIPLILRQIFSRNDRRG
ncbi:MAG: AAA family ATPase [Candidatus Heimdallarchaeota archaeon]